MNKAAPSIDPFPSSSGSRYEMLATIASGGMATVYVGRMRGVGGFSRMVAVKRAHPHLLQDPTYRTMLVDEARLAAKLHHPNVVAVLDVEELDGELSLVMDYVEGTSLYDLVDACQTKGPPMHPRIAMRVALDACAGLHAAHTLADEYDRPLGLVHRDVSPQNILVGLDGVSRLSDFGIAKHSEGAATSTGVLKGKLSYMAPEYLEQTRLDARSDVFSLGVVVWEALAGQKLFRGKSELETFKKVVACQVPALSSVVPWGNERLDAILFGALARDPDCRYQSAEELGIALEDEARYENLIATPAEVGACVREHFGAALEERRVEVRRRSSPVSGAPGSGRNSVPGSGRNSLPGTGRPSGPGSSPGSDPANMIARSQAPTVVSRPPTPVPSAPASADTAVVEVSGLQRRALPPPEAPPPPPYSAGMPELPAPSPRGAPWKAAVAVGVVIAVGGAIAFFATRGGGQATAPSASAPSPPAPPSTVAATPPRPTAPPPAASTAATPAPLAATALPDATPTRKPGKMPKAHGSAAAVAPGVPVSAWPPIEPPPEPPPEPPAKPITGPIENPGF